jgi:hypothetical protein
VVVGVPVGIVVPAVAPATAAAQRAASVTTPYWPARSLITMSMIDGDVQSMSCLDTLT